MALKKASQFNLSPALLLGFCLAFAQLKAMDVLRLPWIFSDQPQLTADFNFSPREPDRKAKGTALTHVELSLGGRFSQFGLPRGAARAPELSMRCEFISPDSLTSHVAALEGKVSLGAVLAESGLSFSRKFFSSSSRLVFKTEFAVDIAPGDYNVIVSIEDKELSIFSQRTLHVIVPDMAAAKMSLSDLKFCLGVGEELDKSGHTRRVLDPNPWRQVGGDSGWDLIVAYQNLGALPGKNLMRRLSIRRLRGGEAAKALWQELSQAPLKKKSQVYLARVRPEVIRNLSRGIYILKIEMWPIGQPNRKVASSKTFEII